MGNKKSIPVILHEFEIQRIMTMTNFKRDEIVYWHLSFLKDCPDGKLTREKFAEFYETYYPNFEKDKSLESVFKYFDSDGNGTIEFNEFMIALKSTLHKIEMVEKLKSIINDLDDEVIDSKMLKDLADLEDSLDQDEKDLNGSLKVVELNDSLSSDIEQQPNRQDDNNGRRHLFNRRRLFKKARHVEKRAS